MPVEIDVAYAEIIVVPSQIGTATPDCLAILAGLALWPIQFRDEYVFAEKDILVREKYRPSTPTLAKSSSEPLR